MPNKILPTAIVLILIGLLGVGGFLIYNVVKTEQFLEIEGYYDADGNIIDGSQQSIVGGIEGVKYITISINVENKDSVDLTLNVKSLTPAEESKPSNSIEIKAGESGKFTTELIDIEPYEGTIQEFCVNVESEKIPALRESSEVSGCISIQIEPNPSGSFDISLDSSIGEGIIDPSCTEDWICTDWNDCSNSLQSRNCNDNNNCDTNENKPEEQQACEIIFKTNAINGEYNLREVWIDFGNGVYNRLGLSTYDCKPENIFETTPEGYGVCARAGHPIDSRVYLQTGNYAVIFEP